ncbi:unnamed protein product [Heligmosomoides polygyrus]|uniref:Reverse transcriptase domain-containing protein n=1 Tax=Heligmosomoides polygyrus TaxID=6339 RepID=A0A183GLX0_HELPZ|nr:unnamed protein product [Heligmosomoides polygyrus]
MSKQSVSYFGRKDGKVIRSAPLEIKNGLMQGDTLSPLLFCLAIAPISGWLRDNLEPFRTKSGSGPRQEGSLMIGHIFYMNPNKCAVHSLNSSTGEGNVGEIPMLGANSLHKYLGVEQGTLISMSDVWPRVQSGAADAARRLWTSNLTVRQKVNGYNQIVIP